jgi:hypothetical protein
VNRALVSALVAAAVVGAASGTVVARGLDRAPSRPGGAVATDRANPPPAGGGRGVDPAASRDDRADQVLWATSREIHDGDTVVRLERDLDTDHDGDGLVESAPVALQRTAVGWVVGVDLAAEGDGVSQVVVVSPDGTVRDLARVSGFGDVSPDGTRYVAEEIGRDEYAVWDLATRDRVDAVSTGRSADQRPAGVAQFVGLDSVATAWSRPGSDEVVLSTLDSQDGVLLADDLTGPWAVSPDGRWLAGSLASVEDGEAVPGCVVVRPVDASSEGRTDCGGEFFSLVGGPPMPSFSDDSSTVLTTKKDVGLLGEPAFGNPDFRPVPTGERPVPAPIKAPASTVAAVLLDAGRVAVIGPKDFEEGEETRVHVCTEDGCRVVGSAKDDFFFTVLGTAY